MTTADGGPVVVGAAAEFVIPFDLAEGDSLEGKDVRATIRAVTAPQVPIDDSLEAIEVAMDGDTGRFALTAAQTALLAAPDNVAQQRAYYVEFHVPDDDWVAEAPIQFSVRRAAAAL